MTINLCGKVSWFGGPEDTGVSADEGLAFIYEVEDAPHLFLPAQPPGTTGLARRLDPDQFFIACRWDYDDYPKPSLLKHMALVRSPKTGKSFAAFPADWGPHESTGRVADISKGLMDALGITTDDEVEVIYPYADQEVPVMAYNSIAISSGHSTKCQGAVGIINEVQEATRVVNRMAEFLRARGVTAMTFSDTQSTNSNDNLEKIVSWHNSQTRQLDVSVHFNSFETPGGTTSEPKGVEVLYLTQENLAREISAAIAKAGSLKDRGPKYRDNLYVINNTEMPCVLLEICFVNSSADVELYRAHFDAICEAIADVLGGAEVATTPPPGETTPPPAVTDLPRVDIEVSGEVLIFINGEQVGTKG